MKRLVFLGFIAFSWNARACWYQQQMAREANSKACVEANRASALTGVQTPCSSQTASKTAPTNSSATGGGSVG